MTALKLSSLKLEFLVAGFCQVYIAGVGDGLGKGIGSVGIGLGVGDGVGVGSPGHGVGVGDGAATTVPLCADDV